MKRFILCALLLQTTYVIPDSEPEPFAVPFQNIVAASAVIFIPYALSQLHTWWNNYSLSRLDDVALLGEAQKRLFVLQEPFQHVLDLVQKYPIDSTDNYFMLKHELHQCIIQFQSGDNYKYMNYVDKLNTCIQNLKQLKSALQKRIDTLNCISDPLCDSYIIDCTSDPLCNSYIKVYHSISTTIATFTNIYNYLKNTKEFAEDVHYTPNDDEQYMPNYL